MSETKRVHIISYIWPSAIVASIIFYLSCLATPGDIPDIQFNLPISPDKIVHFCMYFGLAWITSFNYIYRKEGIIIPLKLIIFGLVTPILYGGLLEVLQANYFNREGDWWDFLANSIGVISTIPFSLWFKRRLSVNNVKL